MTSFRGFIAIDVNSVQAIMNFEQDIKATGANVKVVEPKNIHITLKFLGDTNENLINEIETIIRTATENLKPFSVKLEGTGVFPSRNYIKVIWIGISGGEHLEKLSSDIDRDLAYLGFKKEVRKFSPHLTIARIKSAAYKRELLEIIDTYKATQFSDVYIDAISLKKSELTPKGPIYTDVKKILLSEE